MQKNNYKNNTGFSLIEMIIYVAIFGMIVITFVSFSNSMTTTRLHNQAILEVNDQGEKIMKTITQTIRNSSSVNSPTIGNNASSLSLVMYTTFTDPTVFSLNNGVLYIKEALGNQVALTNNKVIVSNLTFSNFSRVSTPNIIKISFTITNANPSGMSGTYSFTFNGSAQLRK